MSNDIQARSKKELMEKIAPSHSLDKEKWMKLGDVIQEEIQKNMRPPSMDILKIVEANLKEPKPL